MSTVIVNKVGLDIVDVEIQQKGSAVTDMFFQEPVLDATRDYVVGVSELSIPLGHEPMLSAIAGNKVLGYIRRRATGNNADVSHDFTHPDADITKNPPNLVAGLASVISTNRLVQCPTDLVRLISQRLYSFWQGYGDANIVAGLADNRVYADWSPSGVLKIVGFPGFWKRFFIELTSYGQQILGSEYTYIQWTKLANGTYTTDPAYMSANGVDALGVPLGAFHNNQNNGFDKIRSTRMLYSVYRYAEHRLRVELDADLSIPANILVDNEVQKMHYNVASYSIAHDFSGTIIVNPDNMVLLTTILEAPVFIGNTTIKGKDVPTTDWYKIMSAANVQNMRLHVIIVRREWNPLTSEWGITRNKLNIGDNESWYATLKFVESY